MTLTKDVDQHHSQGPGGTGAPSPCPWLRTSCQTLGTPPTLPTAQSSTSCPQRHQPLPQRHHSRASPPSRNSPALPWILSSWANPQAHVPAWPQAHHHSHSLAQPSQGHVCPCPDVLAGPWTQPITMILSYAMGPRLDLAMISGSAPSLSCAAEPWL